jgi:hypothetical protein
VGLLETPKVVKVGGTASRALEGDEIRERADWSIRTVDATLVRAGAQTGQIQRRRLVGEQIDQAVLGPEMERPAGAREPAAFRGAVRPGRAPFDQEPGQGHSRGWVGGNNDIEVPGRSDHSVAYDGDAADDDIANAGGVEVG